MSGPAFCSYAKPCLGGGGEREQGVVIWLMGKNSGQFPKGGAAYVHQIWLKIPTEGQNNKRQAIYTPLP